MKNLKITLAIAAAFATFSVVPAHAITIDGGTFELDGNIVQDSTVDWASLFLVSENSTLYNTKISEDVTFQPGDSCRITVITGGDKSDDGADRGNPHGLGCGTAR
jgi:hypothetical protein